MSVTIHYIKDSTNPEEVEVIQKETLLEFLKEYLVGGIGSSKIYSGTDISSDTDITPTDEQSLKAIDLEGSIFTVVKYPADLITGAIAVGVVSVLGAVLIPRLIPKVKIPEIPSIVEQSRDANSQAESQTNALVKRSNAKREGSRVPDVVGEVDVVFDKLNEDYTIFKDHKEFELGYYSIGRGYYEVLPQNIKDDSTPIQNISGASVEVYSPFTSPNSGHTPQLTVGNPIGTQIKRVGRLSSVNGQKLSAENETTFVGDVNFVYPNQMSFSTGGISGIFSIGDTVTVSSANTVESISGVGGTETVTVRFETVPSLNQARMILNTGTWVPSGSSAGSFGLVELATTIYSGVYLYEVINSTTVLLYDVSLVKPDWVSSPPVSTQTFSVQLKWKSPNYLLNFSGSYIVSEVGESFIKLANPKQNNIHWSYLRAVTTIINPSTGLISTFSVSTTATTANPDNYTDEFFFEGENIDEISINIVAPSGLYQIANNNGSQEYTEVYYAIEVITYNGNTPLNTYVVVDRVFGSATTKLQRASTINIAVAPCSKVGVKAKRLTPKDFTYNGTIYDEIIWRDCYILSSIPEAHFGDITTVQTKTVASQGALNLSNRVIHSVVTRKLPVYENGTFTTTLYPTKNVGDIICALALDPKIGRLTENQLDIPQIYATVQEIENYFGTEEATWFSYSFDNSNMSFEEMVNSMANAVFCEAYRRGGRIKLSFERGGKIPKLLFCHRNSVLESQSISYKFGFVDAIDGVIFNYIDPDSSTQDYIKIPENQTLLNPREVNSIGIRNYSQAYFHANRIWNKIRNQTTNITMEVTDEAKLVIPSDVVLIADNTRPETQDGQVESQEGLTLELSRQVDLSGGNYVILLQLDDMTVDQIDITPNTTSNYKVNLARAPLKSLSLGVNNYAKATFKIVRESEDVGAYLVSSREPSDETYKIEAVNYSEEFYTNDKDYINGVL